MSCKKVLSDKDSFTEYCNYSPPNEGDNVFDPSVSHYRLLLLGFFLRATPPKPLQGISVNFMGILDTLKLPGNNDSIIFM